MIDWVSEWVSQSLSQSGGWGGGGGGESLTSVWLRYLGAFGLQSSMLNQHWPQYSVDRLYVCLCRSSTNSLDNGFLLIWHLTIVEYWLLLYSFNVKNEIVWADAKCIDFGMFGGERIVWLCRNYHEWDLSGNGIVHLCQYWSATSVCLLMYFTDFSTVSHECKCRSWIWVRVLELVALWWAYYIAQLKIFPFNMLFAV